MVGGIVIETINCGSRVWIDVAETLNGEIRRAKKDGRVFCSCAIYVENTPEARCVSEGDLIWWQGGHAFWTARDAAGRTIGKVEVKLKRLGFSGVGRPG